MPASVTSTRPAARSASASASFERLSRKPRQGRSKASLGRMLAAAKGLMIERGSEDFTLQDVSKRGNVSIGSIYLRFDSKDNLVRAVIFASDGELGEAEDTMYETLRAECRTLDEFMPRFVSLYADVLCQFAPLLRLSMERAAFDPQVAGPGRQRATMAAQAAVSAIMEHAEQIPGHDGLVKANAAYRIIFATLSRQLSLGSSFESMDPIDWDLLKGQLGRMALAYLKADT